ncbi:T9SS type B sorting domain-containing protein [Hymenobacter rubidus]|uniref:T9SS type B sorting domain-containing protein n=1 Tax=Hymenobacter rubidus TaxID=1441626 RepID=UPI00191DBB1F|nr:gliding motility-associated C-terminal domain-containing protein [Hymenobacter rubidus]
MGDVTVSELLTIPGGTPIYYIRNYKVYGTPPPAFTAIACAGGAYAITVTDATYDNYTVQTAAGTTNLIRNQSVTILPPAGATTISVTGNYTLIGTCVGNSSQPLPVLAPPQTPLFTTLTLQGPLPGGAATLAVGQLPAGYLYTLQIADASAPGGFRRVADVPAGSTSIALSAPEAGCYRISRTDACGTSQAATPVICTLSLSGTSTQNRNQLLLSDAGSPGTTYSVLRNNTPITNYTVIAGGLEDADVQCGTTYTYVVRATQPGGTAISNPISILTKSSLAPAQPQLIASVKDDNSVELTPLLGAPLTPGSSLHYQRTAPGQVLADLGTFTDANALVDSKPLEELLAAPPCYSVRLTDVCGNVSPESPAACPALLTATPADPDGNTVALTWTPFGGPNPSIPVAYTLQRLAADGTVLGPPLAVSGTRYTDFAPPSDRQVARYRLQISGAGLPAGTYSYSNHASVTRKLTLTIPTAFTPNGDGLNDVLEVKGKYLNHYTFVVVDRNGQEVFRGTQRSDTWDGRIQGHQPVLGAYAWRFQQDQEDGKRFTATGSVTILK